MNMLGNFALQQTDNYQCFKLLLSRRYCTLERVFSINEALISVHSYKRAMHFIALESNRHIFINRIYCFLICSRQRYSRIQITQFTTTLNHDLTVSGEMISLPCLTRYTILIICPVVKCFGTAMVY
jgi:hypothetical protein